MQCWNHIHRCVAIGTCTHIHAHIHVYMHAHTQLHISQTSATNSIRSQVINLTTLVPALNYDNVSNAISNKFYDVHSISEERKVCVACVLYIM